MKSNKLLAKSITLGLILAMPYGIVNAADYSYSTITGWGGDNGGTLNNGDTSNYITVTNSGTSQACQIGLEQDCNTDCREERADRKQRFHGDAVHRQICLHQIDHVDADLGDDERRDKRAQDVRDPRQTHVNQIKLFQVALLERPPAHVLPDEVDSCRAVKQNRTERADGRTERDRHGLSFR